jgi:Predicted transcriptional regulators
VDKKIAPKESFSLDELCLLTDFPKRTVRYYIQLGLVSRPVGEARAAKYTGEHLRQLLTIKRLSSGGVSLERIKEILEGEEAPVPPRPRRPGSIEVRSHIFVAPGIEIQIAPEEAGLTPEQVRAFTREVMRLLPDMETPSEKKN